MSPAGGVVDFSLPPAGPPKSVALAGTGSAAGGRELLNGADVFAAVDLLAWDGLRTAARVFAEIQETRKRITNQIADVKADGTPRKDAGRRAPLPERKAVLASIGETEKDVRKVLLTHWQRAVGRGPIHRLGVDTPGLKWFSLARLLGETGHPVVAQPFHWEDTPAGPDKRVLVADPLYVRTQRQWLAYCGFGDPERRRHADMTQDELLACGATRAKTAAWLIATTGLRSATGKADKNGQMRRAWPWRELYDSTKERTRVTHPEWAPWRHQKSAERVMTKAVLIEIYRTAWADVEAHLAAR